MLTSVFVSEKSLATIDSYTDKFDESLFAQFGLCSILAMYIPKTIQFYFLREAHLSLV